MSAIGSLTAPPIAKPSVEMPRKAPATERSEPTSRTERPEKPQRAENPERTDRPDRSERAETRRSERADEGRTDERGPEAKEKAPAQKTQKAQKTEKADDKPAAAENTGLGALFAQALQAAQAQGETAPTPQTTEITEAAAGARAELSGRQAQMTGALPLITPDRKPAGGELSAATGTSPILPNVSAADKAQEGAALKLDFAVQITVEEAPEATAASVKNLSAASPQASAEAVESTPLWRAVDVLGPVADQPQAATGRKAAGESLLQRLTSGGKNAGPAATLPASAAPQAVEALALAAADGQEGGEAALGGDSSQPELPGNAAAAAGAARSQEAPQAKAPALAEQVATALKQNTEEPLQAGETRLVRLQLAPEHLGEIVITLRMEGNRLLASLSASSEATANALGREAAKLQQVLQSSASSGSHVQVDVGSHNERQHQNAHERWAQEMAQREAAVAARWGLDLSPAQAG